MFLKVENNPTDYTQISAEVGIHKKNRDWSSPSLPFFPSPSRFFTSYCTVLYCTILYYTVLYCTVMYYVLCTMYCPSPLLSSPLLSSPSLQKLTCVESLTGGPRMDPDILFSLLRGSLATPSTSLRSVVTQCRLHKKTEKRPGQLDTALTRRGWGRWFIWFIWSTQSFNQKLNGHYFFTSPYRKEINLIQVKNQAWSPSLPFFPSLLCHVFYIVLKHIYIYIYIYNSKNPKTFRKQTLPKVDVLVPKHYWNFKNS